MKCIACDSVISDSEKTLFRCVTCGMERRSKMPRQKTLTKVYTPEYFKQAGEFNFGYPDYAALESSHRKYFQEIIQNYLLKIVPPPEKLLDIGCGPGLFIYLAKKAGYDVLGIDVIKELAKDIKKKFNISVKVGQFENVSLSKKKYRITTSFQTFEHSDKPLRFLQQAYEVLCPKGILLLTTPDTDSFWKKLLGRRWFSYRHSEHAFFWNRKSLTQILSRAGFQVIKIFSDNWRQYSVAEMILLLSAYTSRGKLKHINSFLPDFLKSVHINFPIGSLGVIAQKT